MSSTSKRRSTISAYELRNVSYRLVHVLLPYDQRRPLLYAALLEYRPRSMSDCCAVFLGRLQIATKLWGKRAVLQNPELKQLIQRWHANQGSNRAKYEAAGDNGRAVIEWMDSHTKVKGHYLEVAASS